MIITQYKWTNTNTCVWKLNQYGIWFRYLWHTDELLCFIMASCMPRWDTIFLLLSQKIPSRSRLYVYKLFHSATSSWDSYIISVQGQNQFVVITLETYLSLYSLPATNMIDYYALKWEKQCEFLTILLKINLIFCCKQVVTTHIVSIISLLNAAYVSV